METQPVSTKHIIDTLGHTAPDRHKDDFFLALLIESRREGEANTPRKDDHARPDPYRNKIDPAKDEFRARDRDRDADRVERDPANDDREIEESRADTRPAEDRNADEPQSQREESVETPADREAAPEATDEPDANTTEAGAEATEIANEAPVEKPAESTAAQTTQTGTATEPGAAAPSQGASANQATATGVTAADGTPSADSAAATTEGAAGQTAATSDAAKPAATVTDPTVTAAQAAAAGQSAKTGGTKQPGEGSATPNAESAANGTVAVNGNKGGKATGVSGQAVVTDSGGPAKGQGSDAAQQTRTNPTNSTVAQKSAANHSVAQPTNADAQGSAAVGAKAGTAPGLEQLLANAGKTAKAATGTDGATQTNHTSPAGHVMQASARPAGAAGHTGAQANQPGQAVHIDDVAVHIQRAAAKGQDRINIRLNPAELGQIEVQLKRGADGVTRAVVHADRTETLDLLQRDARGLERALQDAGLKTDSNSLSFSLRDHGQGGLQQGDGQESDTPQFADSDSDSRTPEEVTQAPPPSISSSRALDIRV